MNRLREIRKAAGYTLRDLEEKASIARSTLSEIENGKRKMGVTHAERLAPIFNVSIDFLIGTDAIKVVDSFEDALENLFVMSYEGFHEAYDKGELSDRQRLIFIIIDHLVHRDLTDKDLEVIAELVNTLARKNNIK